MPDKTKHGVKVELSEESKIDMLEMAGSKHFYNSLITCAELHARKNVDYSFGVNEDAGLSNFIWAAAYANASPRVVFAVIRGIKDARLRNLVLKSMILNGSDAAAPLNESIDDTRLDDVNYSLLEVAFIKTYPELYDEVLTFLPCVEETGQKCDEFSAKGLTPSR